MQFILNLVYIPKMKFHHNEYQNVPQNSHNKKHNQMQHQLHQHQKQLE